MMAPPVVDRSGVSFIDPGDALIFGSLMAVFAFALGFVVGAFL